jgi:hypothetical protein
VELKGKCDSAKMKKKKKWILLGINGKLVLMGVEKE